MDFFNKRIDEVIEKINAHTSQKIDAAIDELAGITARQFRSMEKHMDAKFDRIDSQFEDVKDHLVIIDNRIGVRPTFEFNQP